MLHHLETLRKKPLHIKTRYAFFVAFLITASIAGIWTHAVINRFSPQEEVVLTEVDSSLSRQLSRFGDSIRATLILFKPKVQYVQEEQVIVPNRIDLEALVASSTKAQLQNKAQKTATNSTTTRTRTVPTP